MDDLKELEDALARELRHVSAPDGFTGGVMQRIAERRGTRAEQAQRGKRGMTGFPGRPGTALSWAAAAAALAVSVGGGNFLHARHVRQMQQAAEARAQIDLAMQLTNRALNEVQADLDRSLTQRFAQLSNGTEK